MTYLKPNNVRPFYENLKSDMNSLDDIERHWISRKNWMKIRISLKLQKTVDYFNLYSVLRSVHARSIICAHLKIITLI